MRYARTRNESAVVSTYRRTLAPRSTLTLPANPTIPCLAERGICQAAVPERAFSRPTQLVTWARCERDVAATSPVAAHIEVATRSTQIDGVSTALAMRDRGEVTWTAFS